MSFSARRGSHFGWSGADCTAESVLGLGLGVSCFFGGAFAGASCAKAGRAARHSPAAANKGSTNNFRQRFTVLPSHPSAILQTAEKVAWVIYQAAHPPISAHRT